MKGTNNNKKSKKYADDLEEELGDWETDSDDDEEEDDEEIVIEEIKKKDSSKTGIKSKPPSTSNGINSGKDDKTNDKMNNKNSSHIEATVSPKIRTEVGSQLRTHEKPASSINGGVEHSKTTDKKSVIFSSSTDKKNGGVDVVSNDTKNEKKINAKVIPANNKIDKTENLNASGKENKNENGNGNDVQPEILSSKNLSVGDRVLVNSR